MMGLLIGRVNLGDELINIRVEREHHVSLLILEPIKLIL
jgi:hypothetical protein